MLARLSLLLLVLSLTAGCPDPDDAIDIDASVPRPGRDADPPPSLGDSAPDATPPAASCTPSTPILLDSPEAVAAIAGCQVITGDLVIGASSPTTIELPVLEELVGSLRASEAHELGSFSAPSLRRISGDLGFVAADELTDIAFPLLRTVGGDVELRDIRLSEIRFANLSRVETLAIQNVPASTIVFASLELVGTIDTGNNGVGVLVDGARKAVHVGFPELTLVHGAIELHTIGGATATTEIELPVLETSGPLVVDDVRAHELAIPELRTVIGGITIFDSSIDVLSPGRLASVPTLTVRENFHLPDLIFPSLTSLAHLRLGKAVGTSGTCEPSVNDGQTYVVSLPKLDLLQSLSLCGDSGLEELSIERVKTILFSSHVQGMERLRALRSPVLAKLSVGIVVRDNPALESWDEALTSIGSQGPRDAAVLVLRGNPALSCRADGLLAALAPGKTADIGDNGDGCAP